MAGKDLSPLHDLLTSTAALLGDIDRLDRLVQYLPDQGTADIHSQIRRQAMVSFGKSLGAPIDGRIEIDISNDGMRCIATVYPPVSNGRPLDMKRVEERLEYEGIRYGVAYEVLHDAVLRSASEGLELNDVLVAKGKPPIPEVPEYLLIRKELLNPQAPPAHQAGRVEHRERSPFVFVKKGELLAKHVHRREGRSGRTIFGKELPAPLKEVTSPIPGENTQVAEDGCIYAAIAGRFVYAKNVFWINPVLDIPHDVDYSTGHVDFSGDVIVRGSVKDGFNVATTGSLFCAPTIAASDIVCGKDLMIGRGIIGRSQGTVSVGDEIRCKFIEHAYVEAKHSIRTLVGSMNSVISTNGRFETGPQGILVGGRLSTLRDRLSSAIERLGEASTQLLDHLDRNEEATITVREEVHPNTYLEICHVAFVVNTLLRNVVFRLDREKGIILAAPLKRRS